MSVDTRANIRGYINHEDTRANIRGYVNHEDIINYIRENWDENVTTNIRRKVVMPLTKCDWSYKINEHSDDPENWYGIFGIIYFTYKGEKQILAYSYDNINSFSNLARYSKLGLAEMVQSETTALSLGHCGSSVEILKTLTEHFGGGWLDEDDCDDDEYYPVEEKSIKSKEKTKMKQMTILATDIGSDNHGAGSKTYSFSYLVSENCPDLLQAIKAAATEYCQTEDGKKTYDGNCCNFNIGDFDAYVPDDICLKHGFVPIKHNDHIIDLDFNEQLVEESDIFPEV